MDGGIPEGTLVGGRWRIVGFLGAGGFGQVLLAEDISEMALGLAAVKVLHPNTTPQERQAFLGEVKKIAVLRHQNLVGYLDSGQLHFDGTMLPDHGGEIRPYLVTELCERSLDDHIATSPGGRLSATETTSVLSDVTAGLVHLHERDLIHRDIKPGNALYADGHWKLADFGLMRDLTATGSYHRGELLIGTPVFMAPELFNTMMATAPSDVYAVGVLAHLCAAGRPLHAGAGPALIHNIATVPPSIDPTIDPRLVELIRRCVSPQPEQRPTASQLAEWLRTGPPPPRLAPIAPDSAPEAATQVAPGGPPRPAAAPGPSAVGSAAPAPSQGGPPPFVAGAQPVAPTPASGSFATGATDGPWASPAPARYAPPVSPHGYRSDRTPSRSTPRRWLVAVAAAAVVVLGLGAGAVALLGTGGDAPAADETALVASDEGEQATTTAGSDEVAGEPATSAPRIIIGDGVEIGDGVVIGGSGPPLVSEPVAGAETHFDSPPCLGGPVNQVSVTNRHPDPVDYQLTIHHFDEGGVRIAESFETVRALPPGQTALMGMKSSEEGAASCEIESFTVGTTPPTVLAAIGEAEIVSCVLDEFFGNWYDIVYTIGNPTEGTVIANTAFGIIDADGVRIDESFTNTVFGIDPGERVQQETSEVFWNMDEVDQDPVDCIVTWVEIEPDPTR